MCATSGSLPSIHVGIPDSSDRAEDTRNVPAADQRTVLPCAYCSIVRWRYRVSHDTPSQKVNSRDGSLSRGSATVEALPWAQGNDPSRSIPSTSYGTDCSRPFFLTGVTCKQLHLTPYHSDLGPPGSGDRSKWLVCGRDFVTGENKPFLALA